MAALGSVVLSSFQHREPGSFTTAAPACVPGCHTANAAPPESSKSAVRPASETSIGGRSTRPPALATANAVASVSATAMWVVHAGVAPRAAASLGSAPSPAACRPWRRSIVYTSVSPSKRSSQSHPNKDL